MSDDTATELERLRADLEVFERYAERQPALHHECDRITREIARLEAKQADPWRELREILSGWNGALDNGKVIGKQACTAAAQLESLIETNERLAARVAELEAEIATTNEITTDYSNFSQTVNEAYEKAHKPLADTQPPFEGPIVGLEPILDPARVLATAAEVVDLLNMDGIGYLIRHQMRHLNPKAYPVRKNPDGSPQFQRKGAENGG